MLINTIKPSKNIAARQYIITQDLPVALFQQQLYLFLFLDQLLNQTQLISTLSPLPKKIPPINTS